MSSIVKPYLLRASLVAGLALILGISLSFIVYFSTEEVRKNAVELVEHRIPTLTSINQIIADLSKQERIIYEYYATQNDQVFWRQYQQNKTILTMHSQALFRQGNFGNNQEIITAKQQDIENLVQEFNDIMLIQENNWDQLRALLVKITAARTELLPTLLSIEKHTQAQVDHSHQNTLAQMEFTHWMVVFYGISIVFFAIVGAYYIKQYILTNAKNTRLALFSKHNPNPILSINNLGETVFSNPACYLLLEKVGLSSQQLDYLIPDNFLALRQEISKSEQTSLSVEQQLKDRILQVNINWLKHIDAYDIHIVDITERKLAEQEVNHLAFYVQETNLPNRYKLNNDLNRLLALAKPFSLGVFEISQFGQMVRALGVKTTEHVVQALAKRIGEHLPAGINFYQLNDRQFALVCLKKPSSLALQAVTANIISHAEKPIITDCGEFFLELDFGYSFAPEHGDSRDRLIKNALTALSVSINDEHQHFTVFMENYATGIQANALMLDHLRNAISNEELFLVYQPQLDIRSQRITGIETLVRWRHNDGIISPVDFIPLAEQSGLIVPIGKWILEQACLFAKDLVQSGFTDIIVAVNVSPRQFSHPNFLQTVLDALKHSKLAAANLELEITEGVFMHNEEQTITLLEHLKGIGIHLSIDDFGTGYSSLSYLKRFPVDKLKIDQSFIRDCHNNDEDKAIVKTIVALGKSLGLSLIAEGVEEQSHVEFLQAIDCDEIQGYWYARPMIANDLVSFIRRTIKQLLHKLD